jgi:ABC-type phosphate transport system substrate-binding protein
VGRAARRLGPWCLLALCLAVPARAAEIAVVVNPALPATDLDMNTLRQIYLGQRDFLGDVPVHPVDYRGRTKLRDSFLVATVGMSCRGFESYWVKEVFRSGHFPPRRVAGPAAMLKAVAEDPGAIGFVPVERLESAKGVRKVLVLTVP